MGAGLHKRRRREKRIPGGAFHRQPGNGPAQHRQDTGHCGRALPLPNEVVLSGQAGDHRPFEGVPRPRLRLGRDLRKEDRRRAEKEKIKYRLQTPKSTLSVKERVLFVFGRYVGERKTAFFEPEGFL